MKKLLFLTAILSSLLIGFVSCSDEYPGEVDPWLYVTVKGELSFNQNDGVYYFTATDNFTAIDDAVAPTIEMLKDSLWPIYRGSSEYLSLDMNSVGNVTAKIVPEFKDSIMIREIIPEKASKGDFPTPELNTPLQLGSLNQCQERLSNGWTL